MAHIAASRAVRRTQAERRTSSEQRVLNALAELIVEQGVRQTTLTDIGQRAGCSHTLIVHLFGSKAELLQRFTDNVDEFFINWITGAQADRSGGDALHEIITSYLRFVKDPSPSYRANLVLWCESLIGSAADLVQWGGRWDERFHVEVTALIRRGVRDGSIRSDVRPAYLASAIVNILRGVAIDAISGIRPASAAARAAQIRLIDELIRG
jgi:AcrR family transcriptional regulator